MGIVACEQVIPPHSGLLQARSKFFRVLRVKYCSESTLGRQPSEAVSSVFRDQGLSEDSAMTFEDARTRLWNHANLPGNQFPETQSLVWALWEAGRRKVAPDFGSFGDDILACLQAINARLNGPVPSARIGPREDSTGIAELAYPIACIIEAGLESHRRWSREATFDQAIRDELLGLLHRVSYAWSQVLAGDIDHLLEGFCP
jgi:hypothetical protein